ncbi:GspH/FimT family pseudopilin [Pararhodobacter zhoushanensis]|uniref:Type II secretion system protein H n=1 Tax=Pararhodobacter zhoushanensis TaxID=2479545 RepID=A0ABT3GVV8_9RHOB|nr:GspH/FimT family pseudopilin [Pararhodobacter zhoushanensis]MCW1931660.1 GspH/FimT family pseudopilin [Pararhodobacter zhoushanensis]
MRISPAGRPNRRRRSASGFTLIELLVVITLIAILAVGTGLSAGGVFARPSGVSDAARLEQGIERARDAALLGRTVTGIYPRADGWVLAKLDSAGTWVRIGAPLVLRGASVSWQIDGRPYLPGLTAPRAQDAPPIRFAADGRSTPFTVALSSGTTRRTCSAANAEALQCAAP